MSRIDESIAKMEGFIKEIEEETINHSINLAEDSKKQVQEIANRTISTINNSIAKLNEMKKTVEDDSQLEDFLNRLEFKCKDVTDFTKEKIEEIKPIIKDNLADLKNDLEKGFDDFKKDFNETKKTSESSFDKLLENENIKAAIKLAKDAKDKAIEFYNDPRTQKAINQAKLKAIELAEKGLDELKVLLDRDDTNKQA